MTESLVTVPIERIEKAIFLIRGEKVMLDRDLASLYGVTTSVLKQAVRRNIERLPRDFMFVLNKTEFEIWRSQSVISNADQKRTSASIERVERATLLIRGEKVILDAYLAVLYGVSTTRLKEQVKRNADRFPKDCGFRLTKDGV